MKKIDKNSRIPLYIQLMEILVDEIENHMEENDQLPSEREICEKYGLSRTTVRQAISELERDGYVYKQHGKGTYVAPRKVNQNLARFYSFTEEMKRLGKKPVSNVLSFKVMEADKKIARKMKRSEGDHVYEFVRLRLADDIPMLLETTYVPHDLFPGIRKEDLESMSLYDMLRTRFGVKPTMAEEVFRPVVTRDDEAKLLQIPVEIPSLKVERFTYDGDIIVEYTNTIARGDLFEYRVRLENKN